MRGRGEENGKMNKSGIQMHFIREKQERNEKGRDKVFKILKNYFKYSKIFLEQSKSKDADDLNN